VEQQPDPRSWPAADVLMTGSPPPPGRLVTLANWQDAPFNRWGFTHVQDLMPTARIARGPGPAAALEPGDPADLARVEFPDASGRRWTVTEMLDTTFTDGYLVLSQGLVVAEGYGNGMAPDTRHLLMSVSKSLTAALTGALIGDGRLAPADLVTDHVGELRGTSFDGCTVQHLLDMRAGTRFSEEYEDPASDVRISEQVAGWRPRTTPGLPPSLFEYIPGLAGGQHGTPFNYRSILPDVLAWVLERAGGARFAELFSREIWAKLGPQEDAAVTVDPHGYSYVDGGICATLRDLARFGQMHLREGSYNGRLVVPASWVRSCLRADPVLVAEFAASEHAALAPGGMYHNYWWVLDPAGPVYTGLGIHGQQLLIHVPAGVVVAKLSTWPTPSHEDYEDLQNRGAIALAEALAAGDA
jgi:CubicO group peptidase (beta-lactamase class C family)